MSQRRRHRAANDYEGYQQYRDDPVDDGDKQDETDETDNSCTQSTDDTTTTTTTATTTTTTKQPEKPTSEDKPETKPVDDTDVDNHNQKVEETANQYIRFGLFLFFCLFISFQMMLQCANTTATEDDVLKGHSLHVRFFSPPASVVSSQQNQCPRIPINTDLIDYIRTNRCACTPMLSPPKPDGMPNVLWLYSNTSSDVTSDIESTAAAANHVTDEKIYTLMNPRARGFARSHESYAAMIKSISKSLGAKFNTMAVITNDTETYYIALPDKLTITHDLSVDTGIRVVSSSGDEKRACIKNDIVIIEENLRACAYLCMQMINGHSYADLDIKDSYKL